MLVSVSDEDWRAIDALGLRVDANLEALDTRLMQGGEPTFISLANPDAPEWNTTAIGPGKRRLAEKLLRRLAPRFAPGALLHYGQGKWYPGEALPRWSLGVFWRKDGVALWSDDSLAADGMRDCGFGLEQARGLVEAIAAGTGLSPDFIIPAFEDPWPVIHEASRLPVDVDPLQHDLRDAGERARLARLLHGDLAQPAGLALPLRPGKPGKHRWISSRWPLNRARLYLIPGSSPSGYRLPLDTLPEAAADQVVRTALCIEPRAGVLHVFMPPLEELDDYIALLGAVERAAASHRLPVCVEGFDPPADPRLNVLRITPDPGVIEVNLPPAASWSELASNTRVLDEEARAVGLTTVKYSFDGRPLATGGGNHVTLGSPSWAESPFLKRPDLLQSLLTYWQHHPALSYMFSGLFVGPTSQAPRIDEARDDLLCELAIAFQQLDAARQPVGAMLEPRIIDGLLRHLLVDVTGNAHRAEFCIDKLFAPGSPGGQLGVLELRAFEMPPDWRMGMIHSLLVRALVARFWKTPYRGEFRRWGGALHDRFMLPHFLNADLREVLHELAAAGCRFDPNWFMPFFEFRFPLIGSVRHDAIEIELRQALEPWLALGEQAASGASSRPVDSSLERIQVMARGLDLA
ncbi:MAG: transglutaminase family protein, partial [Betaproteobacteria bacterium]|nr:transglutaminase family protein [Betaproteobacteria bacterium]